MEHIGKILKGRVISFKTYGVFVKTEIGIGMIHISELTDGFVNDIEDFFSVGDDVMVKVLGKHDSKYKFSYKQVKTNNTNISPGFKTLRENLSGWIEEELKNSN